MPANRVHLAKTAWATCRAACSLLLYSLGCLLIIIAAELQAQDFRYDVEIVAPAALKKLLENNLLIVKWRDHPRMTQGQLRRLYREAPAQIETLVATEGYYAPLIRHSLQQANGRWIARFVIEPGAPTRVAKVNLIFSGPITKHVAAKRTLAALRADWPLKRGAVFRQGVWETAKRNLLQRLLGDRYPKARIVESQAKIDPAKREAALRVMLASGPAYTFNGLRLEGLKRYPASIVENLNPIRSGSPYSQASLLEFQTRLQDSGYFSRVEVIAEPDSSSLIVPVSVNLVENAAKRVAFGIGYSTDTGNRAQVTYQDLNILRRGWRFDSTLILETKRQSATADFSLPTTPEGYQDSLGLALLRNDLQGEVTRTMNTALKRSWGEPRFERSVTLQYVWERRTLAGIETDNSQSLPLTYGWTLRRTDNILFPTEGYFLNAQVGGAPLKVLTDRPFLRAYARFAGYYPLGEVTTLILRAEAGAVAASARRGIPSVFLFRTGGDQSVRGYAYQSLGVREGDAIVGGRYLAVASIELQRWLTTNWGAAVFYDVGDADDNVAELALAQGYGVGGRWKSPIGPLNLDLAYGKKTDEFRIHFSLGLSF